MLCRNCGSNIPEGSQYCPYCSMQISNSSYQQFGYQEPATKKKKKWPIIAGVTAIIALIGGAIALIFAISSSKGYEKEIENFFAYFEEKEDDAEGFITEAYWGGLCFGNAIGGNVGKEANTAYISCLFEVENASGSSLGGSNIDNWEDYLKESSIDYIYGRFDKIYGDDWELTYKIANVDELSDSKVDDLQDEWEETVENYEEYIDQFEDSDADIDDKDIETIEDFIDEMSDKKIKKAYEIEVDVEIEGDDASLDESYEFKVVKVGNEWVILEGPTVEDFIRDAE